MPTKKRNSKTQTPAIEIVPFSRAEANIEAQNNLRLEIARMVEETVQQALSGQGAELQPFFGSKEVSYEIKRRQTVLEQNKFTYYFEDWGCMVCGSRKAAHGGCGMCGSCYRRVAERLRASLRKRQPPKGADQPSFMDTMRIAREALAPAPADEAGKNRSKT